MSVRDHFTGLGIDVSGIDDIGLESVGLDIMAEFGEIEPTVDQVLQIVERHLAKPGTEAAAYVPSIAYTTLLDFEARQIMPRRRKVRAIREAFGISETRYVQLLNRALDDPGALLYAPMLVARLTRQRDNLRSKRWGSQRAVVG